MAAQVQRSQVEAELQQQAAEQEQMREQAYLAPHGQVTHFLPKLNNYGPVCLRGGVSYSPIYVTFCYIDALAIAMSRSDCVRTSNRHWMAVVDTRM